MNKNYNIAVVINLVDSILLDYNDKIRILDIENKINFIRNTQKIPHITLCIGKIYEFELKLIIDKLKSIFKNFLSFSIETRGLGLFLSDDINLYIRWTKSIKLLDLKREIEDNLKDIWKENLEYNDLLRWFPKTSLAFYDINYLNICSLNYDVLRIQNQHMFIKEISIVKFELNKDEKELKRFFL